MGLIIGVVIFAIAHVWAIKQINKLEEPCSYDTTFCRDVRVSEKMLIGVLDLEVTRAKLNRRNSKF